MTAKQYRAAIAKLGLSQRAAARFFGVNERTSRRWAKEGTPETIALLIDLVINSPETVKRLKLVSPPR